MATIVVQRQPKQQNNIWEQAAVNLIGGLITDAIQRGRETTQNRKMNIAMGEWANALANNAPTTTNYMQGIGTVPEGYNSNGWANAAHQSYSPLEQFNMGTADLELTPLQTANQQQPQQTYVPTMADAQKAWSTILANPRFSMLNRENADKLMTNYFNTVQQNYDQSRKDTIADTIANASDSSARMNELYRGVAQGILPIELLKEGQAEYQYNNPHQQAYSLDSGGFTTQGAFDPRTGQYNPQITTRKTPSPSEELQNQQYYDNLNFLKQQHTDITGLKRDELNHEIQNTEYQNAYNDKVFNAGRDDTLFNREQLERQNGLVEIANIQNNYNSQIEQLNKEEERLRGELNELDPKDSENTVAIQQHTADINAIRERKQQLIQEANQKIAQSQQQTNQRIQALRNQWQGRQQTNTPVWTGMFEGGTITDKFGARGGKHGGLDIGLSAGTPIRMNNNWGGTFTVSKVVPNDPSNEKNGYGNHVILSSNINGHKVDIVFGHLQNKSINLREGQQINPGDIIGKAGNTGRTGNSSKGIGFWFEGKDWGNHLHLEVRVDGHKIDPYKYYEAVGITANQQPQDIGYTPFPTEQEQQNIQQNMQQGQTTQPQQQQNQKKQTNKVALWRNEKTGEILTEEEYDNMLNSAYQSGTKTVKDIDDALLRKGYERVNEKEPRKIYNRRNIVPTRRNREEEDYRSREEARIRYELGNESDKALKYYIDYGVLPAGFAQAGRR